MKLSKLALMAAPVLLLQACATTPPPPPPEAVTDLSAKDCQSDVSTKDAISLMPLKKAAYHTLATRVDAARPCVGTGTTKANYVVFAIPAHGENHTVTVGGVQEPIRTFAPTISLLDANGKVTRAFGDDRLVVLGNTLGVQLKPMLEERYILVQSNPRLVGKAVSTLETRINVTQGYSPATAYSYGYSYQTQRGVEGTHNRVFSHEGTVTVTVQAASGKVGLPYEK